MQKIRFINSEDILDVSLSFIGNSRVKCCFQKEVSQEDLKRGFVELNEHNLHEQSNFSDYTYIYRFLGNNTYIMTNKEDDVYTEQEIIGIL
ncbi:MAG: hypothetical protein J6W64_02420 [Bacilli bacterium]|nr:hypothetical protein [Bacilli bacterium]